MSAGSTYEIWFVTGSQHLYGDKTLAEVAAHANAIAASLGNAGRLPVRVVPKPPMTRPEEIRALCREANQAEHCIGLVLWMHTFSPAQMWIPGLSLLTKPILHLHTQFNRELPWATIDMDFMNLNQSAHGDREFGFITAQMKLRRKVVTGFWDDAECVAEIAAWCRAAKGWHEAQHLKVVRIGDNMREVAVTEGNKVTAHAKLGFSVEGFGVGDLVATMREVSGSDVEALYAEYKSLYTIAPEHDRADAIRDAARIELGLRRFLEDRGAMAFTDTFQDLHGLAQLPGIAVQRLMADGYGFGGEGDWKTAALVRIMKVMAEGAPGGGTSFMEDYTYDFRGTPKVLGAHMLEVCPTLAAGKPTLEVHPLGIGGKADPVRLVFTAPDGPGIMASLIDMGDRFRIVANEVDVIQPTEPLPKLPVARAVWVPRPSLKVAATAWIYAGGAHHTGMSQALRMEHIEDFAEMAGVELIRIDAETRLPALRAELRGYDRR